MRMRCQAFLAITGWLLWLGGTPGRANAAPPAPASLLPRALLALAGRDAGAPSEYRSTVHICSPCRRPSSTWSNGRPYTSTDPRGLALTYSLTSKTNNLGTKIFTWTNLAQPVSTSKIARALDNVARLTSTALINSGGTTLNSHAYTVNAAGQRTQQTWASGSYVNYGYDSDSQLQSAVGGNGDTTSLGYKYDSAWNLNTRTNGGATTSFTVDTQNQLTGGPSSPYSYDNNGNLTSKQNGNFTYSYDADNRLTTVTYTATFQTSFAYDGLGRLRVRQEYNWSGSTWVLAGTTWYLYDGRRVIQERDGSNTPTVSYTRGVDLSAGLEGAGGIGGLLGRSSGYSGGNWSTHYYYHADGNGSITYVMDSSQGLGATYRYDPYGNVLSQSGPLVTANVYQFSSKEWHSKSGLFYYGFRFYDPNLQRWMNRDPIGELGGINLYGLAGNGPVNIVDPYGLFWPFPSSDVSQAEWDKWGRQHGGSKVRPDENHLSDCPTAAFLSSADRHEGVGTFHTALDEAKKELATQAALQAAMPAVGKIVGAAGEGAAGALGKALRTCKKVPKAPAEGGMTTLFHGSDVASVNDIVANGIDKEAASALGGGDVFWATTEKDIATLFAQANPKGGPPAVAAFTIPASALQGLVKSGAIEIDRTGAYMVRNWEKFNKAVIHRGAE